MPTKEKLQGAVAELEQALDAHERWIERLYAVLICNVPPEARDFGEDAFHACRFGRWYYGAGLANLELFTGFAEIEIEHKRVHQYAAALIETATRGEPVSQHDLKRFTGSVKRMRLEIASLKHELELVLYNLDPLTGVSNRVAMFAKLRQQHELAKRDVHPVSVAMFDVDHFKVVNDTYGHAAGDRMLVAIAQHLQAHVRPYDQVFRYGGEEFLLCMPDADLDIAHKTCLRLGAELAALEHPVADGPPLRITISSGVAQMDCHTSVEGTVNLADQALLVAKRSGRNCSIAWDPSLENDDEDATAAA